MRKRSRKKLSNLGAKEHCLEACLAETSFECRSASWNGNSHECSLSDHDRHSVSELEIGDQVLKASFEAEQFGPIFSNNINDKIEYLENNCVYETNKVDGKLCEFRKLQDKLLKTVDSIYQNVSSFEECKHKCLNAPYRCYSFDYSETSENVCRTSHLSQDLLITIKEPYMDVVGAITYELSACFDVALTCGSSEMIANLKTNKLFNGKVYARTRPNTCLNDVKASLNFKLSMRYDNANNCDIKSNSGSSSGVLSTDIVIQHHDKVLTTQDLLLSLHCHYDLTNKSVSNSAELMIAPYSNRGNVSLATQGSPLDSGTDQTLSKEFGGYDSPLSVTSLAATVMSSPNVTMKITNINGSPVGTATVGDRLALMFEVSDNNCKYTRNRVF